MAQQSQYQRDLAAIDGQLDQLVEITGTQNQNARAEGAELEAQTARIGGINQGMDRAQTKVDASIEEIHSVSEMTAGNWISWVLAILLFIGIIVIWVV
jgi:hypothetical protein